MTEPCDDQIDYSLPDPIDRMTICDLRAYAKRLRDDNDEYSEMSYIHQEVIDDQGSEIGRLNAQIRVSSRSVMREFEKRRELNSRIKALEETNIALQNRLNELDPEPPDQVA